MLLRLSVLHRRSISRARHQDRIRRRPLRPEGLEERCLLSGISGYTTYPVPSGNAAFYLTTGSDGNVWFTEGSASKVAMMNATTHAVSEFATPTANSNPREITTGPDGNIWFTEYTGNKLGMVNITTHAITEYTVSATRGYQPWGITVGPDHNIWFTGKGSNATGVIGLFNPTTRAFSLFPTPANNAGPQGITLGPDGNLWFTESVINKIGEIDPASHAISEFAIPADDQPTPNEIAAGTDGNLWFSEYYNGASGAGIGFINPSTQAFTLFITGNLPTGIASGPDGNLWFSGTQLGRVDVANDAVTQFPITTGRGLATGPDGNLWFTSGASIVDATLSATQTDLVVTQQPPSSVTAGSSFGLTVTAQGRLGQRADFVQWHGHRGVGQQPRGRQPRRYAVRASVWRRGDVLGVDADESRGRLQPGDHQRAVGRGLYWRHHRDACGGDAVGDHTAAAGHGQGQHWIWFSGFDRGPVRQRRDRRRQHSERRVRYESSGGNTWRHTLGDGEPGRRDLLWADDQQDGLRLRAPGLRQRPRRGGHRRNQCDQDREKRRRARRGGGNPSTRSASRTTGAG